MKKNSFLMIWLTLFTSAGTLICCAFPIIFVMLGLGTAVAAMTSTFPFLITLSIHKIWIFLFSGLMLILSTWFLYAPNRDCPSKPETRELCNKTLTWNKRIYWLSVGIWGVGFFASYLALPLRKFLNI